MENCCSKPIIKIRQGDSTNFNGNQIIFRIKTECDLTGYSAVFKLQHLKFEYPNIQSKSIELVISKEQSIDLEIGRCSGWLQIIDANGNPGTLYEQPFLILEKKVF